MRFLIIQTAFIGDVILATSLIEKLQKFYPNSKLDFLLRKGNENLLENHPYVKEIIIWDKNKNKYRNLFKILEKIRKKKYHYLINCQRFTSSGFLTTFSQSRFKIGFDKNPFSRFFTDVFKHKIGNKKHEIERNHELISFFTDKKASKPKLYPTKNQFEKIKIYQKKNYICIFPTSVWFTKQMPKENFLKIIKHFKDFNIFLIGSKNDFKYCEMVKNESNNENVKNLSGKLQILETAALMKEAKMNYVNDSAPLHLASAMNANVTAFFCSTVPDFGFTPLSDNSKILQTEENLKCRPCGLHGYKKCKKKHFKCGYLINIKF